MVAESERVIPPFWASAWGEDKYGAWVAFNLSGIEQRFRWIQAGEFWMGSPESEPERSNNEHRHHVRLTKGYWMAETACTQELWQYVMGNNPSRFQGEEHLPVENVSWQDCQTFLATMNGYAKGLNFRFPTEAEWEYACRAGQEDEPFSFGVSITSDQVNFNGRYPYNNSERSKYRQKTVPVASLPRNAWGLYEMHGNVWEWCMDAYTRYVYDPQTMSIAMDPCIHSYDEAANRVMRGGSWLLNARLCRSAYRSNWRPSIRDSGIGFRLVSGQKLRSTGQV